jgi:hypothetical protein
MAIFRGTTGTGSSDNTIVSAVTEQAGIATTKADEASASASTATTKASEASASATTATNKAGEASADATIASTKATEANTAKGLAEDAQTAAESARDTALIHANTANSSAVQTVAGSNTQVVGVYNNIANVNTVAGVNTDVTTVAGISSDVTTVAADASDIGTVSTNIANVNNVGNNIANVNAVHGNASNINTVAADGTDIGTVATSISDVNTVAGISSDVTTVAGLESKMNTVIADASDIGAVAGNIGDVTTVAGINADVDTVAGIAAKVTTVADNISDVQAADTNATNAATSASNASASATSASNSATTATTKATEASNSATSASNSATTATTKASQAAGSATTAGTSASTATTKASEASASATTATTKAGEAASSASAASGYATTATTKAAQADVSATSAASSATDSSNAASTWTNYYSTYLGMADASPTTDVQGNALQTGAFYYDTGAGSNTVGLYVYNGSAWVYSTNYNNVTAPYSLAQDLATNSHDISFGDNAKAQFGAGNDLQIYHNGSHSYVRDNGTGHLFIQGQETIISGNTSGNWNAKFVDNGDSVFYHSTNGEKLKVTSTGIDVTGAIKAIESGDNASITMRGFNSSTDSGLASLFSGRSEFGGLIESGANGQLVVGVRNNDDSDGFSVVSGGNHPEYMDDNVYDTELFTVRSNGKVGIGTASPENTLTVGDTEGSSINQDATVGIKCNANHKGIMLQENSGAEQWSIGVGEGGSLKFYDSAVATPAVTFEDVTGNVGIGTSNPEKKLHVEGDVRIKSAFPRLYLTDTDNNSDYSIINANGQFGIYDDTNATYRMVIANTSGNVGIGTSSPSDKLHVSTGTDIDAGNIAFTIGGSSTSNGRTASITKNTSTPYELTIQAGNHATSNMETIFKSSDSQETMRIDSAGHVGIGTSSPATRLDVKSKYSYQSASNGAIRIRNHSVDQFGSIFHIAGTQIVDNASYYTGGQHLAKTTFSSNINLASGTIKFYTNGGLTADTAFTPTERMRIDSSGNVGIGTSSFYSKFHVGGNMTNYLYVEPAGDSIATFAPITTGSSSAMNVNIGSGMYGGSGVETARLNFLNGHGNDGFATGFSIKSYKTASGTATDEYLAFEEIRRAANTGVTHNERMRIDSSGNVGIGTSSPSSLMHLSANTGAKLTLESTDPAIAANEVIGEIDFYSNDASGIGAASRGSISLIAQDAAGAGSMLFKTSNASSASAERLRIDSSGNLLVGTTSQFTGGSKASTTVTVDGSVGRKGNRFDDFDDVWSSGDAVIIEGVSNFNPSNSPNGENWYFVKAVTLNTGASNIYCTQTVTTLTGKIFTRYNNNVVGSGSWTSWVEK